MAAGPAPPRPRPADDATVDQLWSASGWDSVPLFMRSLPPSSSDPAPTSTADNGALEALQALVYESSPEETVRSLRERGNELFRSKRWKEAKGFYDQAIEEVMLKDGQQVEQETKRAVYSNRAACHYELGNFGSCLRDCAEVLAPPIPAPASSTVRRSLFRSAKACFALKRHEDALDALDRLEKLDRDEGRPADKEVGGLRQRVRDGQDALAKKEREEQQKREEGVALGKKLAAAFQARGLLIPPDVSLPVDRSFLPPNVSPPSFVDASTLAYPVYILQPLADPPTRDLVLSWEEDAVIWDHISSLVSPSDRPSSIYITTRKKRVLKVGKALTWKQVLKGARDAAKADGVELLGGWCLELLWVPDGERAKAWIEGWKRG